MERSGLCIITTLGGSKRPSGEGKKKRKSFVLWGSVRTITISLSTVQIKDSLTEKGKRSKLASYTDTIRELAGRETKKRQVDWQGTAQGQRKGTKERHLTNKKR